MGLNGLVVLKAAAKEASEITIKSGYWKSQNHPMSAAAFKKPEPTRVPHFPFPPFPV